MIDNWIDWLLIDWSGQSKPTSMRALRPWSASFWSDWVSGMEWRSGLWSFPAAWRRVSAGDPSTCGHSRSPSPACPRTWGCSSTTCWLPRASRALPSWLERWMVIKPSRFLSRSGRSLTGRVVDEAVDEQGILGDSLHLFRQKILQAQPATVRIQGCFLIERKRWLKCNRDKNWYKQHYHTT